MESAIEFPGPFFDVAVRRVLPACNEKTRNAGAVFANRPIGPRLRRASDSLHAGGTALGARTSRPRKAANHINSGFLRTCCFPRMRRPHLPRLPSAQKEIGGQFDITRIAEHCRDKACLVSTGRQNEFRHKSCLRIKKTADTANHVVPAISNCQHLKWTEFSCKN